MKKKKMGLWLNVVTIVMCVCAIAIGVYSVKTARLSISGSIGFTAHDCRVKVSGILEGAYIKETEDSDVLTTKTKYFNSTKNKGGEPLVVEEGGENNTWNIDSVFFDDLNCPNDQIATPMVFTFTMTNESGFYDVFAEFGFEGDLQTKLNISIDFSTTVAGYNILYTQNKLCVLEFDNTKEVTATITLTPKDETNFSNINLSNFKIKFYKQPTAIATENAGEYEYNNLTYTISSTNNGYAIAKVKSGISVDEIFIPPQVEIDGTIYESMLSSDFVSANTSLIKKIYIPSSVTNIPARSFIYSKIEKVFIPNTVTSIGKQAFYMCKSLTSVEFGENSNLNFIRADAFSSCSSLESIIIPKGIKCIYESTFSMCQNLVSITFESNSELTYIEDNAFSQCCSLLSISIPNSVTSIGSWAFSSCGKLTSVTFGENSQLTSIGNSAFRQCTTLISITIPEGVTSIGDGAFYSCNSITSITIPSSVTKLGVNPFRGCENLSSLVVEIGNSIYDSRNNCNAIIKTSSNELISGCKNTVIPNSITSIGDLAFYECKDLTSITIPNSITSIGDLAFYFCKGLDSIAIPNNVTSIGENAFLNCSTSIYKLYYGAYYLGNENNPYMVLSQAYMYKITSCTINENCKIIVGGAFSSCNSLPSIKIPNSVIYIGDSTFSGCSGLTSVTFEKPNGWKVTYDSTSLSVTLTDSSTNATYLTTDYRNYTWTKNS